VVQQQMQFDGPLGPPEAGPVEHRQAEIDRGGVQADQLVLESELLPCSHLHPTALEELEEDLFIKLPGAMLVGIGQGGPAGSGDAQMLELPFTASEPSGDLSEGMGSAQLAKEHGDKLPPAGEASGMTFGAGLVHRLLELDSRKQLQELAEYATESIHQWPSLGGGMDLLAETNLPQTNGRASLFFKT